MTKWRGPLFAIAALAALTAFYVLYSALNTIGQLDAIERERDRWQHPDEIIAALDLKPGNTVVDLGSGAGYFSLKVASVVGERGQVEALDLRRLSLLFLAARGLRAGRHNIHTQTVDPTDPHLQANSADAVLICNTYHEITERRLILNHVFRALRPEGRLVIVDRERSADSKSGAHEVALEDATADIQAADFHIIQTDPTLLTDPDGEVWWLIVAEKW